MVMLDALWRYFRTENFWVFHIDHGIRDAAERKADRVLIQAFCAPRSIPIAFHALWLADDESRTNVEARARKARYAALAEMANLRGIRTILLAQHADDAVETQIMRLFQGWSAGESISAVKEMHHPLAGGQKLIFLRPWITLPHEKIAGYQKAFSVPFHEDLTNQDNAFLRNRIRNELLPLMRDAFPGLNGALNLLREKETRNKAAIEWLLRDIEIEARDAFVRCEWAVLKALPESGAIELIRRMAATLVPNFSGQQGLPYRDAVAILTRLSEFETKGIGPETAFVETHGIRFEKKSNFLYLRPCIVGSGKKGYLIVLTGEGEYRIPGVGWLCLRSVKVGEGPDDPREQVLSIPNLPVVIRSEKDHEAPPLALQRKGFKNLRSYLLAQGIPAQAIGELPLVEIGGELAFALSSPWTGANLVLKVESRNRKDFPFELIIKEMELPT